MAEILITMPEDRPRSAPNAYALVYEIDENDGLDFARGLDRRGHRVHFGHWLDFDGEGFTRMFDFREGRFEEPLPIDAFDLVFAYKFKGHYDDLGRFHAMIDRFERAPAVVVNDPRTIRHNLDKRYLRELAEAGVPVVPTFDLGAEAERRLAGGEALVIKPFHGECGVDVHRIHGPEELDAFANRKNRFMAQPYLPGVRAGERTLVFLGREFQHAVLKRPDPADPHEFRCNESLGGRVDVYRPTVEDHACALAALDAYAALGYPVHFSRIDLLSGETGPVLLEAELTNPSVFANYAGRGTEFGAAVARYLESLL